jgi:glyoxylase-like metal-dependent hydrolase (beta-lactamase superfamily II)
MPLRPDIESFFDPATHTFSYVVSDPETGRASIIDSVLDYYPSAGRTNFDNADKIIAHVQSENLEIDWILETHIHADHLSAAPYLKDQLGGLMAIGAQVTEIQSVFGKVFNEGTAFQRDGSQFDVLFDEREQFAVGGLQAKAIHTPGHTPACMTYLIGNCAFVGDTLFMPDFGTARCDFPGGDPRQLYRSIQKIFALPPETRLFMCHDYGGPDRAGFLNETSVAEQMSKNIHVKTGISEEDFVRLRQARDAELNMPDLLVPSVQVNMRAGQFPEAEDNGVQYLKLPLNLL